ncbi:MAG: hypothetical protein WBB28_17530 [Crinalium sp.]
MNFKKLGLASLLGAGVLMLGVPVVGQAQITTPVTPQVNTGNLITALNNIVVEIGQLNALNDLTVENVRVVNVTDVLNGNNVEALNNALNRNNVEILNLRDVLNNNEVIKNALNNNKVAVGQVVAIDVLSGGDVILFYQK